MIGKLRLFDFPLFHFSKRISDLVLATLLPEGRDHFESTVYGTIYYHAASPGSGRIGQSPFPKQPSAALAGRHCFGASLYHAAARRFGGRPEQRHALCSRQLPSHGKSPHPTFRRAFPPPKAGMAGHDDPSGRQIDVNGNSKHPPGISSRGSHLFAVLLKKDYSTQY